MTPVSGARADDRLPIGAGGWRVWPHVAVRSAGFPLDDLLQALRLRADEEDSAPALRAARLAATPRLRSALLWQNPPIARVTAPGLARQLESGTWGETARARHTTRARLAQVAKYLQRYHARNETVGFFGPVAWSWLADGPSGVAPGPETEIAAARAVRFEDWAVLAVAEHLASDPELRVDLVPLPHPHTIVRRRTVTRRDGPPFLLDDAEAEVLGRVDGRQTARALAVASGPDRAAGFLDVLRWLADRGVVHWGIDVPVVQDAERYLLAALRRLPDSPARTHAVNEAERLVAARDEVARSGSPDDLDSALARIDEVFVAVSGGRDASRAVRGRRVVTSQEVRDVDVRLSPRIVADLDGALTCLAISARWFCHRVGEQVLAELVEQHARLAPLYGPRVPAHLLATRLAELVEEPPAWSDALRTELAARWRTLTGRAGHDVALTSGGLVEQVRTVFAGPSPSWFAGRHHSPDVMVAAPGLGQIDDGTCTYVLGEFHAGAVTIDDDYLLMGSRSSRAATRRAGEAALVGGPPRVVPLYPRSTSPGRSISARSYPTPTVTSPLYSYCTGGPGDGERPAPAHGATRWDSVTVERGGAGLDAVWPDGRRMPVLTLLGEQLHGLTAPSFEPFALPADGDAFGRVLVDKVVVARRAWRIPGRELAPLSGRRGHDLVQGYRALLTTRGVAPTAFWRPERDGKPILVDADSPALVDLLVRTASRRRDEAFVLVEMLPGPADLWLVDARGRRHTSELRLTMAEAPDAPVGDGPQAPSPTTSST